MQTTQLFDDKADLYASSRPTYPASLFDFIKSLLSSRDAAWDCATGNGQAALGLSKIFQSVEASDISKEQISNSFVIDNVHYSVQASEKTNFLDNQFDLINVAQALHWFDFNQFWDEVSRTLKPDGAFIAYSYSWPFVDDEIDKILDERIKRIIEPYWAPHNRLVWNGYRDLDLPFIPLQAPRMDLQNVWDLDQYLNYINTWSATRRCMDAIGSDFLQEARNELRYIWGDHRLKRPVKHPLTIIAGKAWS